MLFTSLSQRISCSLQVLSNISSKVLKIFRRAGSLPSILKLAQFSIGYFEIVQDFGIILRRAKPNSFNKAAKSICIYNRLLHGKL